MLPFAHEKSSELNLKTLPYLNQRAINKMKKIIGNSFDWSMLYASLNYMQFFYNQFSQTWEFLLVD